MRRASRLVLLPLLALGALPGASPIALPGRADIQVEIVGVDDELLGSITPTVRVRARLTDAGSPPVGIGLEISTSPTMQGPLLFEAFTAATDSFDFRVSSPLPSDGTVYLRASARTDLGDTFFSPVTAPKRVPSWLSLLAPNSPNGTVLIERSPTFSWRSGRVAAPPGPWNYEIQIISSTSGTPLFSAQTSDTAFTLPIALQFNTSYRWSVLARLSDGAMTQVSSRSSFVVIDEAIPRATILYQSFPNPFPSQFAADACIWFDLHAYAQVSVDILDLRFNNVKRIYPVGSDPRPLLPPGRYGRAPGGQSGCAGDFSWDGTNERGETVLPGVYILRLRTNGTTATRRLIFRGR